MPPCGHTMQVKDKTCSFNVIFYFEIILIIKSLSTVHACVPSVSPSVTRSGGSRVHVTGVQSSRAGHAMVKGRAA